MIRKIIIIIDIIAIISIMGMIINDCYYYYLLLNLFLGYENEDNHNNPDNDNEEYDCLFDNENLHNNGFTVL